MASSKSLTSRIRLKAFQILLFLIVFEVLLRLVGNFKTQSEVYDNEYRYFFENNHDGWLHTWEPNSIGHYSNPESPQANKYNELGHREKSFSSFQKDTSSIKVVCLGDSFTEGDGTVYENSWVRYVENQLNEQDSLRYNFYNAGVCGSDVFYNYAMLKENMVKAKPNYIIECVNNSDLTDVYYLGGLERFESDGNTGSPNFKNWEVFYKYSFVVRFVVNVFTPYNDNLVVRNKELETNLIIAEQIKRTKEFCDANGIQYIVIIMPIAYEINVEDSEFNFEEFHLLIDDKVDAHSAFSCMNEALSNENIEDFYWVNDGHYNSKGYQELGKCILAYFESAIEVKK